MSILDYTGLLTLNLLLQLQSMTKINAQTFVFVNLNNHMMLCMMDIINCRVDLVHLPGATTSDLILPR